MSDARNIEKTGLGQTPDDIGQRCLTLCQDYLSGVWLTQTIDNITVERLTGGMLNLLYYCAINSSSVVEVGEYVPREVVIKFIEKNPFLDESDEEEKERLLNQMIVSLMVSENGLGPKVYGIFDGGIIYKYYNVSKKLFFILNKFFRFLKMYIPDIANLKFSMLVFWLSAGISKISHHHPFGVLGHIPTVPD